MQKITRQKLILELDKLVRELVLMRDNYTCQWSGKKNNLQVAHIFSRSYLRTRFDLDNLITLNAGVHLFQAHRYPEKFRDFIIGRIGKEAMERLKLKARVRGTIYTSNLELLKLDLKQKLDYYKKGNL